MKLKICVNDNRNQLSGKMDKINEALNKIEAVLKAVNSFQSVTVCGDFEKRYAISWPDVDGGLKAVSTVRDELKKAK